MLSKVTNQKESILKMTQAAYILLNVQSGMLEKVQEGLKHIVEVTEVYAVYGIYDLIVKIEFGTMDELKNQVLNNNIILEGVKNSMTMICVN
jgi:DNA-binding Lrp family transcriptional regulator